MVSVELKEPLQGERAQCSVVRLTQWELRGLGMPACRCGKNRGPDTAQNGA